MREVNEDEKQCCALFIVSLCSLRLSERSIKVDLVGFVSIVIAVRVDTVGSITGILLFLGEVSVGRQDAGEREETRSSGGRGGGGRQGRGGQTQGQWGHRQSQTLQLRELVGLELLLCIKHTHTQTYTGERVSKHMQPTDSEVKWATHAERLQMVHTHRAEG